RMRNDRLLAMGCAIMAAVIALTSSPGAEAAEHLGVAASDGEGACLAFPGLGSEALSDVTAEASVTLVIPREPQQAFRACLGARMSVPCRALERADISGPHFALTVETEHQGFALAIALPSRWSVKASASGVRASRGRGLGDVAFRTCTSSEGV